MLESDHTIILNWSPSIFDIISELVIANESRTRPRIVIMADRDKVEMEDEIAAKVPDLRNTRIICRSGDPTDLYDLAHRQPADLPLDHRPLARGRRPRLAGDQDDPGAGQRSRPAAEPYRIAAEIRDAQECRVARVVGGNEVQLVLADDLIARIVVQSIAPAGAQRGLYRAARFRRQRDLHRPSSRTLVGKTFGEALMAYETSDADRALRRRRQRSSSTRRWTRVIAGRA